MQTDRLAEKLVATKNKSEIRSLLLTLNRRTDVELAYALKEICYAAWTREPTKAQKAARVLEVLQRISSENEIKALTAWIAGIARITESRISLAVEKLTEASDLFLELKKEHLAAQTQVGKLYALALLGRYDEAVECGRAARRTFEKYGDELAAGKTEKNIGNIVSRQEKHREAEKYYLAAHRRFTRLGDDAELTMCENGLAITYTALNDFRRAEKFYRKALARAEKNRMLLTRAEIEASMGNLSLFRARFDEALNLLERSRQKYDTLQMPHQSAVAELEMADAYLELNLVAEAFEIYERITESLAALKMQGEEARARVNFARASIGLGRNDLARRELERSAALYRAEKNLTGEAVVKLIETQLAFSLGQLSTALELSEKTLSMLAESGNFRHLLFARWLSGEILLALDRCPAAEKIFSETFAGAVKQENLYLAQTVKTSLGKAALRQGKTAEAEKYFKNAIRLIENLRDPLPAEEFRMAFLADKLVPYQELAKIYLGKSEVLRAFQLVEQSRSRALAEALSGPGRAGRAGNSVSDKLERELTELREELNWFYSRLNRAVPEESAPLLAESQKREKRINELMRQINNLTRRRVSRTGLLDIKALQDRVGTGRALVEYVAFDGRISAFMVTGESVRFVADLAHESEVSELMEGLHFQFETMRYGEQNLTFFAAELKKRTDLYLHKLYQKLFAPLEQFVADRHLVIVPFGELHYLPFHALFDGEKYLIETREVSYAPSATILQHCLEKDRRPLEKAFLVGFADEKIPFVNEEIKKLKKIFPESVGLTGKKANFAGFRQQAERFDIIHLACHGQFRRDNPLFSALRLADGFLTVRDVGELNLKSDLVTLSACETGLNKVLAGDELLGLTRGFFAAGAASLILTLWTVNDRAAQELITEFYRSLRRGMSIAESLRAAQCRLIGQKLHPYLWSPFFLTGRW